MLQNVSTLHFTEDYELCLWITYHYKNYACKFGLELSEVIQ